MKILISCAGIMLFILLSSVFSVRAQEHWPVLEGLEEWREIVNDAETMDVSDTAKPDGHLRVSMRLNGWWFRKAGNDSAWERIMVMATACWSWEGISPVAKCWPIGRPVSCCTRICYTRATVSKSRLITEIFSPKSCKTGWAIPTLTRYFRIISRYSEILPCERQVVELICFNVRSSAYDEARHGSIRMTRHEP